jgi:PAS domain S-box-containing protein
MEVEFKRRDGTPLHTIMNVSLQMDAKGYPAYLDGTIEDITTHKQVEVELRRLAAAVEQSGEIILITDETGRIQYVNQAFERITGYTRQEALGRKPNLLKSGEHPPEFYHSLWRTISSGRTWNGRFVNRRRDGSLYSEETTISPVFDAGGKIMNYVAAKRDITDELTLEEQYRQMQKMEAIGQLTGGVAHDFNNLLQAINGYTDLAIMDLPPEHRSRNFLEQAHKAGERAASIVQQLLLFSRRQIMKPKVLDLNTVVTNLLKMLGRIIGEHIHVIWHPQQAPCIIEGDSGMLDQMVMNLCLNARDAMPEGGTLMIEIRPFEIDEDFCALHAWASSGRFVRLDITDTGCGMDRETLQHIFEPFFTTKDKSKGTGLGLATVYGIVKQHRGMIDVYSEPGKGTTFHVYLPLYEQDCSSEMEPRVSITAAGGSETVLLAEDDRMVRELGRTLLERAGYTVLTAEDGQQAVSMFQENGDRIALLILDVVMPHLSGRGVLTRIRTLQPDIAALFISGYSESAIHTDFVLHEGLALLQKPYTANALLQAVRNALDKKEDAVSP